LSQNFTQAIDQLYNKYFEALSENLNASLSRIMSQIESISGVVNDGAHELVASSKLNNEVLQALKGHTDGINKGANQIHTAAQEFSAHIENFNRLSIPLREISSSNEAMVVRVQGLMEQQFEGFSQQMRILGEGLSNALDGIRNWNLNDTSYQPELRNIQNELVALQRTNEELVRFQREDAFQLSKNLLDTLSKMNDQVQQKLVANEGQQRIGNEAIESHLGQLVALSQVRHYEEFLNEVVVVSKQIESHLASTSISIGGHRAKPGWGRRVWRRLSFWTRY
jgi:SMC interacting uncharacterized protein involved in chromosome segregation